MKPITALPAALAVLAAACAGTSPGTGAGPSTASPVYEVYAVRYGILPDFPVRGLVEGADSARRMDLSLMVWLLRGSDGRNVLVDAGFYRDSLVERWKPRQLVLPSIAIARLGLLAADVTDVILTHMHWDHADGADLFPNARVWVQRAEWEYYADGPGATGSTGVTRQDVAALRALQAAGRLELVDGDDVEILPGITVYTGGRHTWASQYVGVRTAAGTAILASDNLYLYENLERGVPIAQTLDRESNLRAQERMRRLATSPDLIVPGHDPAVFVRFPRPGGGVARIDGGRVGADTARAGG